MRARSKRMRAHARGERGLMIMNIQQVRENERMVQVGAWGSGSSCPTSGMVAADCPPRPIGRVREPAIVLSPRLAVTIHRRPTDLSRAFSDLRAAHLRSIARDYPPLDRVARGDEARARALINAKRVTPTSYENRNGP